MSGQKSSWIASSSSSSVPSMSQAISRMSGTGSNSSGSTVPGMPCVSGPGRGGLGSGHPGILPPHVARSRPASRARDSHRAVARAMPRRRRPAVRSRRRHSGRRGRAHPLEPPRSSRRAPPSVHVRPWDDAPMPGIHWKHRTGADSATVPRRPRPPGWSGSECRAGPVCRRSSRSAPRGWGWSAWSRGARLGRWPSSSGDSWPCSTAQGHRRTAAPRPALRARTAGSVTSRCPTRLATTFAEFWALDRIAVTARMARDRGGLDTAQAAEVDRFVADLLAGEVDAGPPAPPARVHGDLWSGNVLWGADGHVWLIDPAAHGGHPESDLAMLALFGVPASRPDHRRLRGGPAAGARLAGTDPPASGVAAAGPRRPVRRRLRRLGPHGAAPRPRVTAACGPACRTAGAHAAAGAQPPPDSGSGQSARVASCRAIAWRIALAGALAVTGRVVGGRELEPALPRLGVGLHPGAHLGEVGVGRCSHRAGPRAAAAGRRPGAPRVRPARGPSASVALPNCHSRHSTQRPMTGNARIATPSMTGTIPPAWMKSMARDAEKNRYAPSSTAMTTAMRLPVMERPLSRPGRGSRRSRPSGPGSRPRCARTAARRA